MSDFELARESITISPDFSVFISEMADKTEQRRLVESAMIADFDIKSPPMLYADLQTYFDHFKSTYGPLTSFTFTNPADKTEYTVRYVPKSYKITYKDILFQVSFKLKIVPS